jgi:hypothetical protein
MLKQKGGLDLKRAHQACFQGHQTHSSAGPGRQSAIALQSSPRVKLLLQVG